MNFRIQCFRQRHKTAQRLLACAILVLCAYVPCSAQVKNSGAKKAKPTYTRPSLRIGVAGGANFNFYSGTLQRVNEVTIFPSAFHKGNGIGIYAAPLLEYHGYKSLFGVMLQTGVDDRTGTLDLPGQELKLHLGYISVEPSIRLAPFRSQPGFFLYGGPRLGFLVTSNFIYKRQGFADYPDRSANPDAKLYISSVRKNPVSMQVGAGYDIVLNPKDRDQVMIAPFVSWFPTMWHKNIRTIESIYLNTVRAGIALKIGVGERQEPPQLPMLPEVVPDRDGDGIPDISDRCPDSFGLAKLRGCPDRDGDGIANIDDKCPDVYGLERYQGCPIPDTDGDGINDEIDKCPTVPGVARYQGCPIPDTDGDGVNDEEDKCINEKGPASNYGCPVIGEDIISKVNRAAQNIFFATGSSQLLAKSNSSLNAVVDVLNSNPGYKVSIEGHTDNTGKADKNQVLSEARAASVKAYLVSKGISAERLAAAGFGMDRPIADNTTTAGRARNRRVQMKLSNY